MGNKFIAVVAVLFVAEISSANERKEIDRKRRDELANLLFNKQIQPSLHTIYHGVDGSDPYSCIPNNNPKCDCLAVSFKAVGEAYTVCTVEIIGVVDKFDISCATDGYKGFRSILVTFKETLEHYVVNITFHLTNNECSAALSGLESAVTFVEDTREEVKTIVLSGDLNEKVIKEVSHTYNTTCVKLIGDAQAQFELQAKKCAELNPKGKEKTSKVK